MKPAVDVWIDRVAAETLTPTSRSIIDNDAASVVVRTCVLGHPLQRRITMSLAVDEATAAQFAGACRRQKVWERMFFPGLVVVLLAFLVASETAALAERVDAIWTPVMLTLFIVVVAGRMLLSRSASPHHPRRQGRQAVLIRGVDREAAESWVRVNAPESIRLIERERAAI